MLNLALSAIHSLQLIPVEYVSYFAYFGTTAALEMTAAPLNADAIPGTITVQSSETGTEKNKVISFKRAPLSPSIQAQLTRLLPVLMIAIYTDEAGNRRVCGSPAFPLRLGFTISGGSYNCTLNGRTTGEDPIVTVL